jgi:hypothetical protein
MVIQFLWGKQNPIADYFGNTWKQEPGIRGTMNSVMKASEDFREAIQRQSVEPTLFELRSVVSVTKVSALEE